MALLSSAALATAGDVSAVGPIPELGFALQMLGAGGVIGSALALRMRARDPKADTWMITTAWAVLGFVAGAVIAVLEAAL